MSQKICKKCGDCCRRLDIAEFPLIDELKEKTIDWGDVGFWSFVELGVRLYEPLLDDFLIIQGEYLSDEIIKLARMWMARPQGYWIIDEEHQNILIRIPLPCRNLKDDKCALYGNPSRPQYCIDYFCDGC